MNKFRLLYIFPLVSSIAIITPLHAGETQKYTYDSEGRLTKVDGSLVDSDYEYDDVDNRIRVITTSSTSDNGAPPPPPPPPPPPSLITLTDNNLNVLAAHQSTYVCGKTIMPQFGVNIHYCSLSSGVQVYFYNNGAIILDPGYSLSGSALRVQSNAYGTGN